MISQALQTGGGPNVSDAYTMNGLPGPFYNCSAKGIINYYHFLFDYVFVFCFFIVKKKNVRKSFEPFFISVHKIYISQLFLSCLITIIYIVFENL